MTRRIHVPEVTEGDVALPEREAHHVRDVLRLTVGAAVELFDDAGRAGRATLIAVGPTRVVARVEAVHAAARGLVRLAIAAAVPKANRADWMAEKLGELDVDAFIPLATARSVVLPEGKNKVERWQRLATEAAKQSRRTGVMRVDALTPLAIAVERAVRAGVAWHLSTAADAEPIVTRLAGLSTDHLTLFVGPEGGWTAEEIAAFASAGVAGVSLTRTVLRIETAALTAAAVAAVHLAGL